MENSVASQRLPSDGNPVSDEVFQLYRTCYFCHTIDQPVCVKCHAAYSITKGSTNINKTGEGDLGDLDNDREPPVDHLPPAVLTEVFSHLDDWSLWTAGNVCQRWRQLVRSLPGRDWRSQTMRRWPLFKPTYPVHDWFTMYGRLMESCPCRTCLFQFTNHPEPEGAEGGVNQMHLQRVVKEYNKLTSDPQEGIEVLILDESYTLWAATIAGPVGSPYEGGIFYLYLHLPHKYPFQPPAVCFLSKIFHPNVTRHGDFNFDWSPGLMLEEVLKNIQIMLSDPECEQCAEPEVGKMFEQERERFEAIARSWTWRYAAHHIVAPDMYT